MIEHFNIQTSLLKKNPSVYIVSVLILMRQLTDTGCTI